MAWDVVDIELADLRYTVKRLKREAEEREKELLKLQQVQLAYAALRKDFERLRSPVEELLDENRKLWIAAGNRVLFQELPDEPGLVPLSGE